MAVDDRGLLRASRQLPRSRPPTMSAPLNVKCRVRSSAGNISPLRWSSVAMESFRPTG